MVGQESMLTEVLSKPLKLDQELSIIEKNKIDFGVTCFQTSIVVMYNMDITKRLVLFSTLELILQ